VDGQTALLGTPGAARLLAAHDSPPLAELIARMNKPSDNLIAETLLKELGATVELPGTSAAGLAVVRQTAARLGLDPDALRPYDGSGLSRMDLVSVENLCHLLAAMDAHPQRDAFIASLPVAAVDGTLRNRFAGTPAAGNLRAKTGTLSHVSALSGYVTTADGERLAFALITNNDPGPLRRPDGPRPMEDTIGALLATFHRERAPSDQRSREKTAMSCRSLQPRRSPSYRPQQLVGLSASRFPSSRSVSLVPQRPTPGVACQSASAAGRSDSDSRRIDVPEEDERVTARLRRSSLRLGYRPESKAPGGGSGPAP
jgi:D-Ala-D-Ala carboxypeptidase 3 (S13) family